VIRSKKNALLYALPLLSAAITVTALGLRFPVGLSASEIEQIYISGNVDFPIDDKAVAAEYNVSTDAASLSNDYSRLDHIPSLPTSFEQEINILFYLSGDTASKILYDKIRAKFTGSNTGFYCCDISGLSFSGTASKYLRDMNLQLGLLMDRANYSNIDCIIWLDVKEDKESRVSRIINTYYPDNFSTPGLDSPRLAYMMESACLDALGATSYALSNDLTDESLALMRDAMLPVCAVRISESGTLSDTEIKLLAEKIAGVFQVIFYAGFMKE